MEQCLHKDTPSPPTLVHGNDRSWFTIVSWTASLILVVCFALMRALSLAILAFVFCRIWAKCVNGRAAGSAVSSPEFKTRKTLVKTHLQPARVAPFSWILCKNLQIQPTFPICSHTWSIITINIYTMYKIQRKWTRQLFLIILQRSSFQLDFQLATFQVLANFGFQFEPA